jgi:hypothetical protein
VKLERKDRSRDEVPNDAGGEPGIGAGLYRGSNAGDGKNRVAVAKFSETPFSRGLWHGPGTVERDFNKQKKCQKGLHFASICRSSYTSLLSNKAPQHS